MIEDLNPQTLAGKIRYYISCWQSALYFTFREEHTNEELNIRATRAPLPEDIIWGNVGLPLKMYACRKIVVALMLLGLIGCTFLFTYFVTLMQMRWPKYSFLSFIFALVLTLMNMLVKCSQLNIQSLCASLVRTKGNSPKLRDSWAYSVSVS